MGMLASAQPIAQASGCIASAEGHRSVACVWTPVRRQATGGRCHGRDPARSELARQDAPSPRASRRAGRCRPPRGHLGGHRVARAQGRSPHRRGDSRCGSRRRPQARVRAERSRTQPARTADAYPRPPARRPRRPRSRQGGGRLRGGGREPRLRGVHDDRPPRRGPRAARPAGIRRAPRRRRGRDVMRHRPGRCLPARPQGAGGLRAARLSGPRRRRRGPASGRPSER